MFGNSVVLLGGCFDGEGGLLCGVGYVGAEGRRCASLRSDRCGEVRGFGSWFSCWSFFCCGGINSGVGGVCIDLLLLVTLFTFVFFMISVGFDNGIGGGARIGGSVGCVSGGCLVGLDSIPLGCRIGLGGGYFSLFGSSFCASRLG